MKPKPSQLEEQILDLCRQGKKIEAIKLYKESTGIGLRESKDYVDQLAQANRIITPKETGGCFVATACYGNYDALEVLALRQFRDDKLLKTNIGKMFVRFYYVIAPPLAAVIAKSDLLKNLTRKYFLAPLAKQLKLPTNSND